MNKSMLRLSVQLSAILALGACAKGPGPAAPGSQQTTVTMPNPQGSASAYTGDIPLGPVFPPARPNVKLADAPTGLDGLVYRAQRWFKDSAPTGDGQSFTLDPNDDTGFDRVRNQDPERLRPALDAASPHAEMIGHILDRRGSTFITQQLKTFLTVADAKAASSAAELLIKDVFSASKSSRAKLTEMAGDLAAIKRFGYYDEAIAGRREYLQARADETYRRGNNMPDLREAFFVLGVPALTGYLLGGSRFKIANKTVSVLANAGEHSAAVSSQLDQWLLRANAPADQIIKAKLAENGLDRFFVKADSIRSIKKLLKVEGSVTPKLEFTRTADPNFSYAQLSRWDNMPLPDGYTMYALRLQDGPFTKVVTTNHLGVGEARRLQSTLENIAVPRTPVINPNGVVSDLEVNPAVLEEAAELVVNRPHYRQVNGQWVQATRRPLNPKPIAQRLEPGATEKIPLTPVGEVAERATPFVPDKPFSRTLGLVGAFAGGATIGLPYYGGYANGFDKGVEFNTLDFGGQIDPNVPSSPATTETSESLTN